MSILRSRNRRNPYRLVVEHTFRGQLETKQSSALRSEHKIRFGRFASQVQIPNPRTIVPAWFHLGSRVKTMQKLRNGRLVRVLNAMREGLRLHYEGKGLPSFVSNERGSHGGDNLNSPGLAGRSLSTSVKPNRGKPARKRCSFIPPVN